MEMNNNDMLKSFFDENKREIANNGFSNRVLKQIPETPNRDWIVWVFAAIGISISILSGYYSGFFSTIYSFILHIPVYYFPIAVFCFPLVAILAICSQRSCRFRPII